MPGTGHVFPVVLTNYPEADGTPFYRTGHRDSSEKRPTCTRRGMWTEGPQSLVLSLGRVRASARCSTSAGLVLESRCSGTDTVALSALPPRAAQRPDPPFLGLPFLLLFSNKP